MPVATGIVTLSAVAWTNCGTGPLQISACGGSIVYQIADSQPTLVSPGYPIRMADKPVQIPATSIVWAVPANLGGGNALVSA